MAKETLDEAVKHCDLQPVRESATDGLLLEGAHGWTPSKPYKVFFLSYIRT